MSRKLLDWKALVLSALVLAHLAVFSPGLQAQVHATDSGPQVSKSALAPGDIDTTLSRVYIHVEKTGFGHEHGVEAKLKSGRLQLGANQNAGELVIDMASFNADTDEARRYVGLDGSTDPGTRKEVNNNMLGSDVLDVQKYPTATFNVSRIQPRKQSAQTPRHNCKSMVTLHFTARQTS